MFFGQILKILCAGLCDLLVAKICGISDSQLLIHRILAQHLLNRLSHSHVCVCKT